MSGPTTQKLHYMPPAPPKDVGKAAPAAAGPVITTRELYTDFAESYVEVKLTPDRLVSIFRQADAGYPYQMLMAFEGILGRDCHLRGDYETRMDSVWAEDFEIRAGDRSANSELAAELYVEGTEGLDHSTMIDHALNATFYGFEFTEIAWGTRTVRGRELQVPIHFVNVPAIRFNFDPNGRPLLTTAASPMGVPLERSAGSSWMQFYSSRYRKPMKGGLLRVAAFASCFKSMSVRDWMVLLEKLGIPMILGKYHDNDSDATRKALLKAIQQLGTEGYALLHGDATIEVLTQALRGASDATQLHGVMISLMNAEMSKLISGGTLNSETSGVGSFSAAKVHSGNSDKHTLADAKRIARYTQRDLGAEFMLRNGLPGAPLYLHSMVARENLLVDASLAETMSRINMPMSKSQLQKRFNFSEPRDASDTIAPPVTKSSPPEKVKE